MKLLYIENIHLMPCALKTYTAFAPKRNLSKSRILSTGEDDLSSPEDEDPFPAGLNFDEHIFSGNFGLI